MGINFASGGEQTARSNVMQVKYTTYDHINFSGQGYHDVKTLAITPYYSDSRIIVTVNVCNACTGGHAGQSRILKSVGGGGYGLLNYSTDGSRAQGHGGNEGNSSDGGASYMIHIWDHHQMNYLHYHRVLVLYFHQLNNLVIHNHHHQHSLVFYSDQHDHLYKHYRR
jgi:hypothetical protein